MDGLLEHPQEVAPTPEPPASPASPSRRSRLGAGLGVASALLLAASFVWAHHWGPLADTIVIAWLVAWPSALVLSSIALARRDPGRSFARLGLALSLVSVIVMLTVGIAAAAGVDPSSLCGGG